MWSGFNSFEHWTGKVALRWVASLDKSKPAKIVMCVTTANFIVKPNTVIFWLSHLLQSQKPRTTTVSVLCKCCDWFIHWRAKICSKLFDWHILTASSVIGHSGSADDMPESKTVWWNAVGCKDLKKIIKANFTYSYGMLWKNYWKNAFQTLFWTKKKPLTLVIWSWTFHCMG